MYIVIKDGIVVAKSTHKISITGGETKVSEDYEVGMNIEEEAKGQSEKKQELQNLLNIKNKQKDLRSEYDATSKLKDSIKDPMRKAINKKRDEIDKEFESLFDELVEKYGEDEVISSIT